MNLDGIRSRLTSLIHKHGSQRAAAESLGISQAHFHDLINGKRRPGPKTLKALGLDSTTIYSTRLRKDAS